MKHMENLQSSSSRNVSSLFITSNFISCVPGCHQHWGQHYWVEFCQLGASSATFSLSSGEVGSSCSGFTLPGGQEEFHEFLSLQSSKATWAAGRDRSPPGAPLGAPVREHRTQNTEHHRTGDHVGKCCGTALQGLGNCSNHKAVCAFSPHSHWNCSQQSVWEEVFTGPFLRVTNH